MPADPLPLIDSIGPRRPRPHPRWRRRPWDPALRRARRRPAGWWLAVGLAALAGWLFGAALSPLGAMEDAGPGAVDRHDASADRRSPTEIPAGHGALALPLDERSLALRSGDRIDLLATDLATGRALVIARRGLVLEVTDARASVALPLEAIPDAAAAVNQGLATAALVERAAPGDRPR